MPHAYPNSTPKNAVLSELIAHLENMGVRGYVQTELFAVQDLIFAQDKLIDAVSEDNKCLEDDVKRLKDDNKRLKDELATQAKLRTITTSTESVVPLTKLPTQALIENSEDNEFADLQTSSTTASILRADHEALARSYIKAIMKSSGNTRREIEQWFDDSFLSFVDLGDQGEAAPKNARAFLVVLAVKLHPMVKMFRVGLGVRLFTIAASSYVDMVTDVLVTIAFFRTAGQQGWGIASLTCVSAGIGFQALFALFQYRGVGFRKCAQMVLAAACGFLPVIEAWSVFRGAVQVRRFKESKWHVRNCCNCETNP